MPKKANEQKAKARKLFEDDGLSLAEIAKQLDIKPNTVKSWKRRDGWIKGATVKPQKKSEPKGCKGAKVHKKGARKMNQASLDNLRPPTKPGEQIALKHGMYAKYLSPQAAEVYSNLEDDTDELAWLREAIKIKMANYVSGQQLLDQGNFKDVQAETQAARTISNMITEYKDLKAKVGSTEEDDDFIAALERSTALIWGDHNEE